MEKFIQPTVEIGDSVVFRDSQDLNRPAYTMYVSEVFDDFIRGVAFSGGGYFGVQRAFHVRSPQLRPAQFQKGYAGSWEESPQSKKLLRMDADMASLKAEMADLKALLREAMSTPTSACPPVLEMSPAESVASQEKSAAAATLRAKVEEAVKAEIRELVKIGKDPMEEKLNIAKRTGAHHNAVAKMIREEMAATGA